MVYVFALVKTSFHSGGNTVAPSLSPSGAGADCDISELMAGKISARFFTGNTALSQPGMPWLRERSPIERHNYYQMTPMKTDMMPAATGTPDEKVTPFPYYITINHDISGFFIFSIFLR